MRAVGLGVLGLVGLLGCAPGPGASPVRDATEPPRSSIRLLLAGDTMTGRAIDQLLPHSAPPRLYERHASDARHYIALAERVNGPLPRLVPFAYPWGDAIDALARLTPDVRLVNLETSVTRSDTPWPGKPLHYRMHPDNLPVLTAAGIDYCALANNHTLDWGRAGLEETLASLERAGIHHSGAGRDADEAARPALLSVGERGRVVVFAYGAASSGIPPSWAASAGRPGINRLADLSLERVEDLARRVRAVERPGDVLVVSIHWGENWGYGIPERQRRFAHALIDHAGVDVVHGHSAHHAKGIEVYRDKLVLYGTGDLLNDYEGVAGNEAFRPDLALLYTASVAPASGGLLELRITPFRLRRMRLERPSRGDLRWLESTLSREGEALGTRVERGPDGDLWLRW